MSSPNPLSETAQSAVLESIDDASKSVQQLFSLEGKFAVVTGGARGLGLTIAGGLLEAGAHVALIDILEGVDDVEYAPVKRLADSKSLSLTYHRSNIANQEVITQTFIEIKDVAKAKGMTIGVVFNCAGVQQRMSAYDYPQADFQRIMNINVVGSQLVAQQAALAMREAGRGGSIVLIASMSGTITNRGMHTAAYNASKSAVLQLARSLAVEFGPNKIRVNSLSPGYILTQMTADLLETDPALAKQWTNDNPLSRLSKPWEFKGPAVFLASDASSFMTGSDLLVDGGHTAW